jgi:hypothetical protein
MAVLFRILATVFLVTPFQQVGIENDHPAVSNEDC